MLATRTQVNRGRQHLWQTVLRQRNWGCNFISSCYKLRILPRNPINKQGHFQFKIIFFKKRALYTVKYLVGSRCVTSKTQCRERCLPTTALWDQATTLLIATVQTLRKVKFCKPYIVYFLLIQTRKRTYFSIHLMQKHPKILMPVHIIQCLIGKVLLLAKKKRMLSPRKKHLGMNILKDSSTLKETFPLYFFQNNIHSGENSVQVLFLSLQQAFHWESKIWTSW